MVFDVLLGEDGGAGRDVADDRHRYGVAPLLVDSPRPETSCTVRDLLGSRLMRPRRSSWFRWLWTVELELRPTASPISRTLGG